MAVKEQVGITSTQVWPKVSTTVKHISAVNAQNM